MKKVPEGWKWVKAGNEMELKRKKYWGTEKNDAVKVTSRKNRISTSQDAAGTRVFLKKANPKPRIPKVDVSLNKSRSASSLRKSSRVI